MIARRVLLAGLAALGLAAPAQADWRSQFRELGFGVIPVETQTQAMASFEAFIPYATAKLGVPVRLFTASDFIGVNNALIAKQIHFAWTSPSAMAGSWLECQCVEPIVAALDVAVYAIDLISARLRRALIRGGESAARPI